jgi:tRNA (guanine37-N1)-methyltransferase
VRIDVISIFPDYLAPLQLSLIGKARDRHLVHLHTHDLRDFTHDRHRTVDDTPYGGGAGMVMKPQPWSEALDFVAGQDAAGVDSRPVLVVPGPSGERFSQRTAHELAQVGHLVFACGRYEGIDERVYDYAAQNFSVRVLSLGDYVLNGGEVAAMAMIEAIVRLLPGVVGNAESLVEESHEGDLLEYPSYTKPADWRGLAVPQVLLSGNHAAIADWRMQQRRQRTLDRRPDLIGADHRGELQITPATPADVGELLTLTHACWLTEGIVNERLDIPAMHETTESIRDSLDHWTTFVARSGGRLVGTVRGRLEQTPNGCEWHIGRVGVVPDRRGEGLGRRLLQFIQDQAPAVADQFALHTGAKSENNLRMYRKAGFRVVQRTPTPPGAIWLVKRRSGKIADRV